jgi:hypothetical protein
MVRNAQEPGSDGTTLWIVGLSLLPNLQKDLLHYIGSIVFIPQMGIQIAIDLHMIAIIETLKRWESLLTLWKVVRQSVRRHHACSPSLFLFFS